MIRTDRLALSGDTFAAERRGIITDAMTRLADPVSYSVMRMGLPRWEEHIVTAALGVFDDTARSEVEEWTQVIDDMREEFERVLREALEKTVPADDPKRQEASLVRWLSTMSVNAGTEAATTADPDGGVGLEWITMGDPAVRHSHEDAAGQTVPTGAEFTVGGEKMLYPGQPVGDPSNWMNCRCVCRPVRLDSASASTAAFSTDGDKPVEEVKNTSSVIVALPAASDPVHDLGPEESHVTLAWLGDAADFDPQPLRDELEAYAGAFSGDPLADSVSGTAVLGADKANVLLLDAKHLNEIRNGLLASATVSERVDAVEQHPTWIPHLTIGYPDDAEVPTSDQPFSPDTPPIPESITFDRIALWHGDEQHEYPLGGTLTVTDSTDETTAALLAAAETDAPDADAPELPEEEVALPVPWHGVLAPEGTPSGDGRQFAVDALTHRDLPLPLKIMYADADGHDGSVICGRIDKIWREDGELRSEGVFDNSEHGYEAVRQIAEGMLRGVSVDVDQVVAAVDAQDADTGLMVFASARIAAATLCAIPAFAEAWVQLGPWQDINEEDAETEDMEGEEFAASDEQAPKCNYCDATATKKILHSEGMAYVATCDEHLEQGKEDAAASVPGGEPDPSNIDSITDYAATTGQFKRVPQKTKDGPGWITNPKPTHRITDYWVDGVGAAKIQWGVPGDFNRCRVQLAKYVQNPQWLAGLCANLHYRALNAWPGQASARTAAAASDGSLTASASVSFAPSDQIIMPKEFFTNPNLDAVTPLTVTEDGRVYGHLATWGVCHIGIGDSCVNAPNSKTNYSMFTTGAVLTDAGPVAVGQISLGGGHAHEKLGVRATLAHYDSTSTAVADVTAGEDSYGIWVSGVLRPGVSAEDVYDLRAAVLSGDWREVIVNGESNLELVAALAVNVPGFPIPRPSLAASGGTQTALVAASIAVGDKPLVDAATLAKVSEARASINNFRLQAARKVLSTVKE